MKANCFLHSPVLTVNSNTQMEADTIKRAAKRDRSRIQRGGIYVHCILHWGLFEHPCYRKHCIQHKSHSYQWI